MAPVKAPFSRQKSSRSIKLSGIVAMLTATKGGLLLSALWCIALATNSLPVSVSHEIETVIFVLVALVGS
ncbi:MAG: hypothetical protein ACJAXB_002402 [Candidatus Endobugula sp.]|jgi:hypothetical protein